MSINNDCTFIGRVTHDLEPRTVGESTVLNFGIACNSKFKDKDSVLYINLVAFRGLAKLIVDHCKKGDKVVFNTSYSSSSFESNGRKEYRHNFIVNAFEAWKIDV